MKFKLNDLEEIKAEKLFVDRIEPRQIFWESFEQVRQGLDEPLVLNYYGVGGIGKSSLHSRLVKELREKYPDASYVELDFDFVERREPYRILALIKKKLAAGRNFKFPLFDVACYTFLCRIGEDGERKEVESLVSGSQVLNFLCDAASIVPGASLVGGIFKLIDEGVAIARNAFSDKKQLIRKMETMDIRLLHSQLPIYFAADLWENLKNESQPLVIFLDTYEKLVNEMAAVGEPLQNDLWLRGPSGLIPRLPNVMWVISGRERLKWAQLDSADQWASVLRQYLLGALAPADAMEFLQTAGVGDEACRKRILELSGGLPVSLDLYTEQYLREGTVTEAVTPVALSERIVRYMSDAEKTACYLLAYLGQWTRESAAAAAKASDIALLPSMYDRLCGFSFILTEDGQTFRMMRQVAEALQKSCPASLSRALACAPAGGKPSADASDGDKRPAGAALSFEAAPEKHTAIMLRRFQNEAACADWLTAGVDARLTSMCIHLELDTYFSVLSLIKQFASQRYPGGALDIWADGMNGYGLYYAGKPEEADSILKNAVYGLCEKDNMRLLYGALHNYSDVTAACMNSMDFLAAGERAWAVLNRKAGALARGAALLMADACEAADLEEEAARWRGLSAPGGMENEEPAVGDPLGSIPDRERTPDEERLAELDGELVRLCRQKSLTQEEANAIEDMVQEGIALSEKLYGSASQKAQWWYFRQCRAYFAIGDLDRGLTAAERMIELGKQFYGADSGKTATFRLVRLLMQIMSSLQLEDFMAQWPEYHAELAELCPVSARRLGQQSFVFKGAESLWCITDVQEKTVSAYRQTLERLLEDRRQNELLDSGFVQAMLENLQQIPPAWDDMPVQAAVGQMTNSSEEQEQVTIERLITAMMEEHAPKNLYTCFTGIPEKKLRNALRAYGEDPEGETIPYVLAMYDSTVLGNGKSGFLLLTGGLMFRASGANKGGILLEDLLPLTVGGESVLEINAVGCPAAARFPSPEAQPVAEVFNALLKAARTERGMEAESAEHP